MNSFGVVKVNIIYLRVSKEGENEQDIESQLIKLKQKFSIDNPVVFQERGSAYKIEAIKKRQEFLKILNICFDSQKVTIEDLFLNRFKKKQVNLYVWDSHRIMRNMEYNLFFSLLCDFFNVEVYTFKDGKLKEDREETPSKKLLRYLIGAVHSFSGEEYSYTTSENTKKAFQVVDGITITKEGLTKSSYLTESKERKQIKAETALSIQKRIKNLQKYYKRYGKKGYYADIIQKIRKEYGIIISKSYISSLKKAP